MKITQEQFERIEQFLPCQGGNVRLNNLQVLNVILYVVEHGCKWRGLPREFGNWHTVYMRMRRWSKAGVLQRMFEQLQHEQFIRMDRAYEGLGLRELAVELGYVLVVPPKQNRQEPWQ